MVTLIGFAVTIFTLVKGATNLRIKNIIELKKMVNDFSLINSKLLPDGEWNQENFDFGNIDMNEFGDFNSYVGIFELSKLMLDNNSLSEKEFKIFFAYRLSNIANCKPVMNNIITNNDSWTNLLELMRRFKLYNNI